MTDRPTDDELLSALRRWARESSLSQSELADRAGIAQPTLSRYLNGRSTRLQRRNAEILGRRIPRRLLVEAREPTLQAPRSPRETPTVFVSSTYLDNKERRAWVLEAIEQAGMHPVAMERWTADPRTPRELSVHRVRDADVFLGILAWRYGWIPDGEEKSITELEYDEAVRLGLPRLMFVIDQPLAQVSVAIEFDQDDPWAKQQRLDAFKKRAGREQTALPFTDENLRTGVLTALFQWKLEAARSDGAAPPQPRPLEDFEQTLAEYLQCVENEHAQIVLPGFEARLRVPLLLDDLYVPVQLAHVDRLDETFEDSLRHRGEHEITLPSALQRLAADERRKGIVLLGHPGSGKTTQLRRLALSYARGELGDLGLPDDLVPVLVPLRELEEEDGSLADLVRRLVADENLGFDADFGSELWERGRLLLLVDGLDEVAIARRKKVKAWIERAARGRKGNVVVTSCRFEGYTLPVRFGAEFIALSLRPLTSEQADTLVQRWYREVEAGVLAPDAGARERAAAERKGRRAADELVELLHGPTMRDSRFAELARNPLLLTAICLVHRDRAKLPERADELYGATIDVLLQHWREAKRLPITFDAKTARQILQPVALWLHDEEGRTQGGEDELCAILEPAMREAGWRELTPRAFLATVRDESGLLTGWSAERYGFMHLGFQEYLAAQALYQRVLSRAGDAEGFQSEVDAVARRFGPSWWAEVMRLVFAIDERGVLFAPLFRAVLRLPGLAEHADLARQCAGDARRFDETPFRELLRLPADGGHWANRVVAADLLLSRGPVKKSAEDVEPALGLLERPWGKQRFFHEEQFAALRVVQKLDRVAAQNAAERLRDHPHQVVCAMASALARPTLEAEIIDGVVTVRPKTRDAHSQHNKIVDDRSGCELVLIPGGRFLMGSPEGEEVRHEDEGPQHEVNVEPFFLAVHPVTNEQYARFLKANPKVEHPDYWADRSLNQPRQPVVGVSWHDAVRYCKWAGFELPTEAQWEYACRAGTTTRFWSGDTDDDLAGVGWFERNSEHKLQPVGLKPANPWGLFDMHGNVWEWVKDCRSGNYTESRSAHPGAFEPADAGSRERVVRGGGYFLVAQFARSASRRFAPPGIRSPALGFRPVRPVP